ncbi:MAG: HNH endonuclease [Caudoviricetes sp.]|nr:MAG: HNH endonuclease [Caudoviricetes sp.]
MKRKPTLTEAWLGLDYNPDTGLFTRRNNKRSIAGHVSKVGYVMISLLGQKHLAHRLAWFMGTGEWPIHEIDHINGIKSDNRLCNLREATRAQNAHNRNTLGYTYDNRKGKWYARIQNGEKETLFSGYFDTEGGAAAFVQQCREVLYGEYAPGAALTASGAAAILSKAQIPDWEVKLGVIEGGTPYVAGIGLKEDNPDPLTALQDEIAAWADEHYPSRTYHNAMTKLVMEEIPEILRHPSDPMEWADAFILLLDAAKLQGVDIAKAVRDKMEINRRRTWAVDPNTGVMRHVRN